MSWLILFYTFAISFQIEISNFWFVSLNIWQLHQVRTKFDRSSLGLSCAMEFSGESAISNIIEI